MPTGGNVTVDTKKWDEIQKVLGPLKEAYTSVGVHEDAGDAPGGKSLAFIAAVHEFGADIDNGWGKGIYINIPERSFMRAYIDEAREDILNLLKKLIGDITDRKLTGKHALGQVGELAVKGMKKKIMDGLAPALSENTWKIRKYQGINASSVPLVGVAPSQILGGIEHKEVLT